MLNKHLLISIILLFTTFFNLMAQSANHITLQDAIEMAKKKSLDYKIATFVSKSSYWNYNSFKAKFLPKLSLDGTLPDYYRTINTITLPSGQNDFVSQNVSNSSAALNLSQNVVSTGGTISINSSLRRIDNLGNSNNTAYTTIPFSVSYYQKNIFYNEFKWERKIEPLKLKESEVEYVENLENIAYKTVEKYFDLLQAEVQLKLDEQNVRNIDTLLKSTQARFEIGTVNLNDLLQTKVSLLNAKQSLIASRLTLRTAQQGLKRYLNEDMNLPITLSIPDSILFFDIEVEQAVKYAKTNKKYNLEFKRRLLEAKQEIKRTVAESGPTVSLSSNFGVTQTGKNVLNSYSDLLRNQSITIGLYLPLVDWGVNSSRRKRAEANLDLEITNIAQQELSNEQEVVAEVMKWQTQNEQMKLVRETRELAQQRYNIALQKYSVSSITYTEFNNAQLQKDRAVTEYIAYLRNFWLIYYAIRKMTLFDFENNSQIKLIKDASR